MPVSVVITREVSSVTTVSFKAHPVLHLTDIILCMLLELESWISTTTQLPRRGGYETTQPYILLMEDLFNEEQFNCESCYRDMHCKLLVDSLSLRVITTIYTTASGSPVYFGTSQYSTLEAYQEATGNDMNSVQTDPNFQTSLTCITCNDTLSDAGSPC